MKSSLHQLFDVCVAGTDKTAGAVNERYPSAASKGDDVRPFVIIA